MAKGHEHRTRPRAAFLKFSSPLLCHPSLSILISASFHLLVASRGSLRRFSLRSVHCCVHVHACFHVPRSFCSIYTFLSPFGRATHDAGATCDKKAVIRPSPGAFVQGEQEEEETSSLEYEAYEDLHWIYERR